MHPAAMAGRECSKTRVNPINELGKKPIPHEKTEERYVPDGDELTMLRQEVETLAAFLHLLQREHAQLKADFADGVEDGGEPVEVPPTARQSLLRSRHIERIENPATGAIIFRRAPGDR